MISYVGSMSPRLILKSDFSRSSRLIYHGPGLFRPWVVSAVSRFARESFRPGSFRPWVVSPLFGESFRPYFSTMPKSVIWCIICYFVLG